MPKRIREEQELQAASDKLYYDIWMLFSTASEMSSGKFPPGVINNALLESFAIHARVLLDFFFRQEDDPRLHKNDIVAEHFFPNPKTWREKRRKRTTILKTIPSRVGKEIAHLSYARLKQTSKSKRWDYLQIAVDLDAIFNQFLQEVATSLFGSRWDQPHRSLLANLSQTIRQRNQELKL